MYPAISPQSLLLILVLTNLQLDAVCLRTVLRFMVSAVQLLHHLQLQRLVTISLYIVNVLLCADGRSLLARLGVR